MSHDFPGHDPRKIRIQKPIIQNFQDESLWREVAKFAALIPFEPDPNMGRLEEIKEEIRNGTYLKPEVIEETAARLALRLKQSEE